MDNEHEDGTPFYSWLEICKSVMKRKFSDMDDETITTHFDGMKNYYRDCYDDNSTCEDAVNDDIADWPED